MARFEDAIATVLDHEGWDKFTNHPADPGGATKWGISLRFLRRLGRVGDVDGDGDVDADDVRKLPKETAIAIYREHWWDRLRLSEIQDQAVATKVFDLAVNMGSDPAVRLLQYALCLAGEPVDVDGILGSQTIVATNRAKPELVLELLRGLSARYYCRLVDKDPSLAVFERGWLRRALA